MASQPKRSQTKENLFEYIVKVAYG